MVDLERFKEVVREIQEVLYGNAKVQADAVQSLQREYSEAVAEINLRLEKCCSLLKKGLRTDALRECDVPPNLFEVVDVADFRERFLWGEFLAQNDLPTPPELATGQIDLITEAVPQEARLKQLMEKHRLFALARAPLRRRLKVLRQIQVKDPENKLWRPDIRSYEQARLKEIKAESKAASNESDLKELSLLVSELESSEWLNPVPESLGEFVQESHSRVQKQLAMQELEEVAHALNDAFADLDVQTGYNLRKRWSSRALIVQLDASEPVSELAQPALEWLQREDEQDRVNNEFVERYHGLGDLLDQEVPLKIREIESDRTVVSRAFEHLEQLRTDLDDEQGEQLAAITQRVRQRLSQMQERERRVRRNRLVGIVLSVLVVAGVTGWSIDQGLVVRRAGNYAGHIQALIDKSELDSAGDMLDKLKTGDPRVFQHSDVQGLVANLDSARGKEGTRLATRKGLKTDIEGKLENPSWENVAEAERLFGEFKKHSIPEKDSAADTELESGISAFKSKVQGAVDDEFLKEFGRIQQEYDSTDINLVEKTEILLSKLLETPNVTAGLLSPVRVFETRVKADLSGMRRDGRKNSLFAAITKAVGDVENFRGELKNFSELADFRAENTSREFRDVLQKDIPLVSGIEAWSKMTRELSTRDLSNLSVKEATSLSARCESLLEDQPGHPSAKVVKQLQPYLMSVMARLGDEDVSILDGLEKALNNPIVAELFMVRTKEGKRFYSRKRPISMGKTTYRIEHFVDVGDLSEVKVRLLPVSLIANEKDGNGQFILESPQSRFREVALRQIDLLRREKGAWHQAFMKLLVELREDKEMEPLLKVQLLRVVTVVAVTGHSFLRDILKDDIKETAKGVEDIDIDVNWIHPEPKEDVDDIAKSRREAERLLVKLFALRTIEETIPERVKQLVQPDVGREYSWVGWLHKDAKGAYTCSMGSTAPKDRELGLFVLFASDGSDSISAEKVGTYRSGGGVKLQFKVPTLAVEGRPVYASEPRKVRTGSKANP